MLQAIVGGSCGAGRPSGNIGERPEVILDQGNPERTGKRRSITGRQLARLVGVSQSAVSRAFTPGSSISAEMRELILKTARELNYHPNAIASMLSRSRTNIVGIVVSEMQNPFYPLIIERLSRALQQVGLQSLMFNVTRSSSFEQQLAALRQYNVDAVIVLSATALSGPALHWATENRAAILVNRSLPDNSITSVCCDNASGAREIADHLYAIGRRRVAYVAGLAHTSTNLERQSAFITRVAELGMTLTMQLSGGEYSYEAGYRAAREIAAKGDTDGIFFANDILAIGGMDALRDEAGLSVPDDIAVVGFDDIAMGSWPRYSLTTYRQPVDDLVDRTVRLIANGDVEPGKPPIAVRLPGSLIKRASSMGGASVAFA